MAELETSKLLHSLKMTEASRMLKSSQINLAIVPGVPVPLRPVEVARLIPEILRVVNIPNRLFAALLSESDVGARADRYAAPQEVQVTIPYAKGTSRSGRIPVTELAAGSVILWELAVHVAATLSATLHVAEREPPPEALISPGSTSFSFGGGTLIGAGIGFIVAAYASVLPSGASALSLYGGAFMSSLGVIDMAINWYRTVNEAEKLDSEGKLNQAKTELTHLEIEKARRELAPASSLVAPEILAAEARRFGLNPQIGSQLINEVMPAYSVLSRLHSGITASPASSRGAGAGS